MALALLGLEAGPTRANDQEALSNAVRVLKSEKSVAEQYAVVLATVGKSDTAKYVKGILLYADAKADFDGLVAELRFELSNGSDLKASTKFTEVLEAAAKKRIAFTSFVPNEVVDKLPGSRPGLPDVIQVVPDLVKAITDSGLAIWKAFQSSDDQRRKAILNDLEQLQWRSFADLAKA
jgi:hypothetical protein